MLDQAFGRKESVIFELQALASKIQVATEVWTIRHAELLEYSPRCI